MLHSFCFYTPCSNRWCWPTNPDWMYQILRKREEDQHPPGDWCQVSWLWSPSAGRSQWSKDLCPNSQTYEWCKWNQYWSLWRMGCWQGHTSSLLEDLNWSFTWHWTKHASWGDWSNHELKAFVLVQKLYLYNSKMTKAAQYKRNSTPNSIITDVITARGSYWQH